jgi:hypothetical protein
MKHIEFKLEDFSAAEARLTPRSYDPELDDVRSMLSEVCEAIDGRVGFSVSGFGQDIWPVDVETDLPVFLESLPGAIRAVKVREDFVIDFYEQGLQRLINFEFCKDVYIASCSASGGWECSPDREKIMPHLLEDMLEKFMDKFVEIVRKFAPSVSGHPWFLEWKTG